MTIHISISDAKAGLSRLVERAAEENEQIVIESHGNPKAVLIAYSDFAQFSAWQEMQRRQQALEELRQLRQQIGERNRDLTAEESEALAGQYASEVIEEMIAEGKIQYDAGDA